MIQGWKAQVTGKNKVRRSLKSLVSEMGDWLVQRRIRKDDLDPRMCKALNELPTELGMEAVEKFSMSNLDNVRSKTGFMVGLAAHFFH